MRITEFKTKHVSDVRGWLMARGLNFELSDDLPAIGFISFDDEERSIAAGFLRQVEGNFLLIDSLITNPVVAPEIRNIAINMVLVELIEQAKKMSVSKILAFSKDDNTIIRAKGFGSIELPYKVIALDLIEGSK